MSNSQKIIDKGIRFQKNGKLIEATECYVKACLVNLNFESKPTALEALSHYVDLTREIILNTALRGKDTELVDRISKIQMSFIENLSRKNSNQLFDESELLQVSAIDTLIGKYREGNLSFLADESLKQAELKQKLLDALAGVEEISIVNLASNLCFSSIATLKLLEAGIKHNTLKGHLTKDERNKIYFSSDYVKVFLAKKLGEDPNKIIKQTKTASPYPIPPPPSSVTLKKRSQKKLITSIIIAVIVVTAVIGGAYFTANPSTLPHSTPTAIPTAIPTAKEIIMVQSMSFDSTRKIVTMYAQSTGLLTPVVNSIIIKDASGSTIATVGIASISPTTTGNALATGTLYTITSTILTNALGSGTYTATLTTVAGGSFISPAHAAILTPIQISPGNNSVFSIYPRTTELRWTIVPNAAKYLVEIQEWTYGSKIEDGYWDSTFYPVVVTYTNSFIFDFVGAQPGRWRVWAVDATGQNSSKTDWWIFTYTR